ncbi:TPA: transcriptional regulator BolA [Proteus mirabilis]|nr:transcriptional regulator BolA [Proteus mirabilis]
MIRDDIENKLISRFSPHFLQVINESHRHNVPAGSESHFKVVIVSDLFNDKRSVSRHRDVYQMLSHELDNGVHALALHTFTLSEWDEQQDKALHSPGCRGGSQQD